MSKFDRVLVCFLIGFITSYMVAQYIRVLIWTDLNASSVCTKYIMNYVKNTNQDHTSMSYNRHSNYHLVSITDYLKTITKTGELYDYKNTYSINTRRKSWCKSN